MKCAIVITLVLAILYCLFIFGDAVSNRQRRILNGKKSFAYESIKDFWGILYNTLKNTSDAEMEKVRVKREASLNKIMEFCRSTHKTENEVAKQCIRNAIEELETESNKHCKQIYDDYMLIFDKSPKVKKFKEIINDGEALLENIDRILKDNVIADIKPTSNARRQFRTNKFY